MNELSKIFRQLHTGPRILRLPNAWDAGSARLVESLGASAVATTSAGVAWALGYQDGGKIPVNRLAGLAADIVRTIKVPLTFDFEDGYSDDPKTVAENIKGLLDAGIVGINLEDSNKSPEVHAGKIESIKSTAAAKGADIFINARADVYLHRSLTGDEAVKETIRRGLIYKAAGADSFFVPAVVDDAAIQTIVESVDLPINVLAWPGLADAERLESLGVRRLSAGSGISKVLWSLGEKLAREFLESGSSEPFSEGQMDYARLQALFAER